MLTYLKSVFTLAVFLTSRAAGFRNKLTVLGYLFRRTLHSPMPAEIFVEMKEVKFWFAPGRSELQPYQEIFGEAIYERDPQFLAKNGDIVIDVGAHIGYFTLRKALTAPEARIFSYEPNPETFARLEKNIKANSLTNVWAENKALSAREGVLTLRISESSSEGNTIMSTGTVAEYEKEIQIATTTLDALVQRHALSRIDILKIDAEGAEAEILRGGLAKALALTRKVEIETHSPALREECEKILSAQGFSVSLRVPSGRNMLGENTLVYFVRA